MLKSALIFTLIFFLSACAGTKKISGKPPAPVSPIQQSLNKHLQQWKQAGIQNYSYEFRRSCFCMQEFTKPVLIRVKNNIVIDARLKENKQPLSENLKDNRQTINMLFASIQDAINRKAYSIKVKYNDKYGYPTSINVDYHKELADEEIFLSAKDLKL